MSPYFFKAVPEGGQVDVQVQALFEEPFGHLLPIAPPYDFYFKGTTSDWSNTQTIAIGESQTPTPSLATTPPPTPHQEPQQTEQEIIIGIVIVAAVIGTGLGLLLYLIKRK